jgi:hypothetical protein
VNVNILTKWRRDGRAECAELPQFCDISELPVLHNTTSLSVATHDRRAPLIQTLCSGDSEDGLLVTSTESGMFSYVSEKSAASIFRV